MNYSAVLSTAEIEAVSSPDRKYAGAMQELERLAEIADEEFEETVFEKSLKLKNTLDAYEEKAKTEPSWEVLAVLTSCEYRLWCLNAETPMRHNPFLTHWVEAFQRLNKDLAKGQQGTKTASNADNRVTAEDISDVRVEWIKRLLPNENIKEFIGATPRELHHAVIGLGLRKQFDIQMYIEMLEEEGIYDKAPVPIVPAWKRKKEQPRTNASKQWKKDMLQKLTEQPESVIQELTHLPLELSYLDFFTTLLTDRTLESHSIEPAPVITSYIQHALRLIEQMEAPPPMSEHDTAAEGSTDGPADRHSIWEYGKEAQSRVVKLLLLFIKSLIRKGLLGAEVLYFEIQEICVRYVWIKEVRDFRQWVEEGNGDGHPR